MNHIQQTKAETPNDSYSVEFYPSTDDYVHIALKTNRSVPSSGPLKVAYQAFLIMNAVGFPAFLWFNDFILAGLLLAGLNVLAIAWLIPAFTAASLRRYYEHNVGSRESKIARVEITREGISYWADEAEASWPWRRITSIEETDETIFFYFAGNGIAVRKSGFAYHEDQVDFVNAAQHYLDDTRIGRLES